MGKGDYEREREREAHRDFPIITVIFFKKVGGSSTSKQ